MAIPQWKFILVNSKDLSEIGELHQARDKSLNLALNTPGSASFTYSFEGNLAADIQPISTGVMAYRKGSTDSYKLVWSGYINEIAEDVTNATMTVSAVGWFERLNKRIARQDILYRSQYDKDIIIGSTFSTPSGGIASGIMQIANKTVTASGYTIASGTIPVVSGSSPYTPTWLEAGTYYDGMRPVIGTASGPAKQDLSIEQDSSFGEAIISLINQENGCDIEVNPANRQLNVYGKKGSVKSDVWFGFNWGPENIASFSNQISTADIANYLVGRATGITAQVVYNKYSYSIQNYGIFEDSLNINLTSTADAAQKLAYYTAAEYFFRSGPEFSNSDSPFSTYSITPYPYTIGSSVPEPFEAYNIGDIVKFRAVREPRVDVEGSFRVFGMSVSISNDGNESIGDLRMYAS